MRVLVRKLEKKMSQIVGYTLFIVMTVDLLATSGDITATWTSPMLAKLNSTDPNVNPLGRRTSDEENSWIGSLLMVGGMVGPFVYGFIGEKLGRKIGLLAIAVPHIISYLTLAFAKTVYLFYFARILGGMAMGGGYALLPMYVAEVSDDANRGKFSVTLNIFWTFGNLIPYVIGPYTSALWFNVIIACVPATFFVCFVLIAPESPYHLIAKNKLDQAEKSLLLLRGNNQTIVEKEIRQIQAELSENENNISFVEFLKNRLYMKGLVISLALIAANQLSGINAIMFYTQEIFESAGANGLSPEVSSIIIGVVTFTSSLGTPFVADRWGRRIVLLISLVGITFFLVVFGVYFYLKRSTSVDTDSISWLPLVSLVGYIMMFSSGLGSLPWTISSELFPTNVKAYAATLVSFTCWLFSFLVTKFFVNLQNSIGTGETFWLFAGCSFAAFVFTLFFVPETKERSFQEIQEILEGRSIQLCT